jgi:hypothetical protein
VVSLTLRVLYVPGIRPSVPNGYKIGRAVFGLNAETLQTHIREALGSYPHIDDDADWGFPYLLAKQIPG